MRKEDQNRINMLTAVRGVVNAPNYKETWQDRVGFGECVELLSERLASIDEQAQVAQGNFGASDVKEQARLALGISVCEMIGAVRACAAATADPELTARVAYANSRVVDGKGTEIVARCRTIWSAANDNAAALVKYGITNSKLAALKKNIDAFDAVKSAPRQGLVTKGAAVQLLPQLVRSAMSVVRDQLDGLTLQFKEANPNFYNEYFGARVIMGNRGGRTTKPANATALPTSTTITIPTPLAKAA
jgi:hypothetical protein